MKEGEWTGIGRKTNTKQKFWKGERVKHDLRNNDKHVLKCASVQDVWSC